jgi:hypothetical protein
VEEPRDDVKPGEREAVLEGEGGDEDSGRASESVGGEKGANERMWGLVR